MGSSVKKWRAMKLCAGYLLCMALITVGFYGMFRLTWWNAMIAALAIAFSLKVCAEIVDYVENEDE